MPLTSCAPGSVVGNFSPMTDDATELKDGDMVKMCAARLPCCLLCTGSFVEQPMTPGIMLLSDANISPTPRVHASTTTQVTQIVC